MRSIPWPSPFDDGPQTALYTAFFEKRLLLKISEAAHEYLMTVVSAYVSGEIDESTALSAEVAFFIDSWREVDVEKLDRKELHNFWMTVFRVTRPVA